jgi:ABC-type uncharacterized transport system ATPase subunit
MTDFAAEITDRRPPALPEHALGLEVLSMTKRFGAFTALDQVSLKVPAGSFHALLGENGAGKSTLVKCIMGYYRPEAGELIVGDRQQVIENPHSAHALGLGMVYQHFTSVMAMTVTENFVLARSNLPAVIDWKKERAQLEAFLDRMPFRLPLDAKVSAISAGERQKCEILKQLYLKRRFLILDETTSVLTPGEADEVLGMLRQMVVRNELTILMITHKFREVIAFADKVTILRRGRVAGEGRVGTLTSDAMAGMMIGAQELTKAPARSGEFGAVRLEIKHLAALDDAGQPALLAEYQIKTRSADSPLGDLSGGNVQRTVLARELSGRVDVMIAANPCFGLDFAAVAQIHAEIVAVRNHGAAVLLVSEDLDELLALADRIVVIFNGCFVYEARAREVDLLEVGRRMAGH